MALLCRLLTSVILVFLVLSALFQWAGAAETTQVTLAWDQVESTEEHTIVGYRVYCIETGERFWKQIGESTTTDFTYYPVTYGKKYQFFVTAIDSIGVESYPSNMVTWPIQVFALKENGLETYSVHPGSSYTVEWYGAPKAATFRLLYSTNKGATWSIIEDGLTGRSYEWTVPPVSRNKTRCLIRVLGFDSKGAKVLVANSDVPFAIEGVRVHALNDEGPLVSGSIHTIDWETYLTISPVAEVRLYYTLNGSSWKKIETPQGYFESFDWEVPAVKKPSYKCKIKVVLKDEKGKVVGEGISDAFTIYP